MALMLTMHPHILRRSALAVLLAFGLAGAGAAIDAGSTALDPLDPLLRPAASGQHIESSVLIGVTRAGSRLVAVGESGIVLISDDDGMGWRQAAVPVSVTLTAVMFATPEKGWAVGHSGVVLVTGDGGLTWTAQLDGTRMATLAVEPDDQAADAPPAVPNAGDPLLDVLFLDEREGYATGAFGMFLHTTDGGANWTRVPRRLPNPDGNHLYGIRALGDHLYVVGERGAVYVSQDRGATFTALTTPYEGSFFGVAGTGAGTVVVYGLQGRAFASGDHGRTWQDAGAGGAGAWTGATVLPDGRMVLVGQAGDVQLQTAGGGNFIAMAGKHPPLSGVAVGSNGNLVAVGPRGIHTIKLADAMTGSATQ
jgi:photosystem II stability/assembly factor-like uncharacterized protein